MGTPDNSKVLLVERRGDVSHWDLEGAVDLGKGPVHLSQGSHTVAAKVSVEPSLVENERYGL